MVVDQKFDVIGIQQRWCIVFGCSQVVVIVQSTRVVVMVLLDWEGGE